MLSHFCVHSNYTISDSPVALMSFAFSRSFMQSCLYLKHMAGYMLPTHATSDPRGAPQHTVLNVVLNLFVLQEEKRQRLEVTLWVTLHLVPHCLSDKQLPSAPSLFGKYLFTAATNLLKLISIDLWMFSACDLFHWASLSLLSLSSVCFLSCDCLDECDRA